MCVHLSCLCKYLWRLLQSHTACICPFIYVIYILELMKKRVGILHATNDDMSCHVMSRPIHDCLICSSRPKPLLHLPHTNNHSMKFFSHHQHHYYIHSWKITYYKVKTSSFYIYLNRIIILLRSNNNTPSVHGLPY